MINLNELVKPLNTVTRYDGYHISYNPSSVGYGSDTTALVIDNHIFLILNDDHVNKLKQCGDLLACLDYYIGNIEQSNLMSEHNLILDTDRNMFNVSSMFIELVGEEYFNKLKDSVEKRLQASNNKI